MQDYPKKLKQRQKDILILKARGLTDAEVAEKMHLAKKTIKCHLSRIYDMLGAKNRNEAIFLACKNKLLDYNDVLNED